MAEGPQIGEAYVRIRPKSDGFEADAQRQIEDPLKRIAKGAAAAFATIAVGGFLKGGIAELGEAQKAAAQTTAALRSTGGQANVTADDIDTLTTSLANLSGADKEVVQGAANLLLTFRNVRNEVGDGNDIYSQALTLAQDLSVAFGQDLSASAVQLGKALDNPVQGVTALQRVGVTLSAQQKDQIKDFVAVGDVISAQKIILEELTKQVGGSAAAFGETLPAKLQRAQNAFDDLKGEVVGGAAPALEGLLDIVRPAVDLFSALPGPVQTGALALGAVALVAPKAVDGVKALSGVASSARDAMDTLALKAMYAKDGMSGAAQGAASLVSSIGPAGLAGGLGVATVATIVFADAQARAAAREREVAAGAKEYQQAIEDQTGALQDNLNAVTARKLGEGTFARVLEGTTADYKALSQGIAENADELDRWRGYLESGSSGFRLFDREVRQAADGGDAFAAELVRLQGTLSDGDFRDLLYQLELVSTEYATGTRNSQAYQSALEGLGVSTDEAADSTSGMTDEMRRAEEASKRYTDQLRAQQDAALDLIGGDIAARDAARDTRRALEELNELRRDGTATADDLAAAQDRVLTSMLREAQQASDNAQKQAEANGQSLTAAERARIQREKLEELATTLAPDSPLRVMLQQYITDLEKIPETVVTTIQVDTTTAEGKLEAFRNRLRNPDYTYQLDANGNVILAPPAVPDLSFLNGLDLSFLNGGPKAAGGRVQAGRTYPVNEYGIEGLRTVDGTSWLTPGTDGTVIPASQMPDGKVTWAPVLNITTTDPDRAARTALRLMRREAAYAGGR